jgi:hypothetical protein
LNGPNDWEGRKREFRRNVNSIGPGILSLCSTKAGQKEPSLIYPFEIDDGI